MGLTHEIPPIDETGAKTTNIEQEMLDDATFEPLSQIELNGDYKQSEAIQNSFTAMMEHVAGQANEACGGQPQPSEELGSPYKDLTPSDGRTSSHTDAPLPEVLTSSHQDQPPPEGLTSSHENQPPPRGSEIAAPLKLDGATFKPEVSIEQSGDYKQTGASQGNFTTSMENAEARAQREPASGGVKSPGGDGVAITPINLSHEANAASGEGKGPGDDGLAITPINLPHEANLASGEGKDPGGDGVAITPINLPNEANGASGEVKGPGGSGTALGMIDQMIARGPTSLSELMEERSLALQEIIDRRTKVEQPLSNVLKGFEDTQSKIIQNMK
jgi:hypothetical protein